MMSTEGSTFNENDKGEDKEKATSHACQANLPNYNSIEDGCIVEWSADSHKAVKCHHWQQHGLSATQEVEEMKLSYASQEGNSFACGEEVLQQLWHCYSRIGDI